MAGEGFLRAGPGVDPEDRRRAERERVAVGRVGRSAGCDSASWIIRLGDTHSFVARKSPGKHEGPGNSPETFTLERMTGIEPAL